MNRIEKRLTKAKSNVEDTLAVTKSVAREQKKRLKAGVAAEGAKDNLDTLQKNVQTLSEQRGALDQAIAQEKGPPTKAGQG
jgi:hypothetical protein